MVSKCVSSASFSTSTGICDMNTLYATMTSVKTFEIFLIFYTSFVFLVMNILRTKFSLIVCGPLFLCFEICS